MQVRGHSSAELHLLCILIPHTGKMDRFQNFREINKVSAIFKGSASRRLEKLYPSATLASDTMPEKAINRQ